MSIYLLHAIIGKKHFQFALLYLTIRYIEVGQHQLWYAHLYHCC